MVALTDRIQGRLRELGKSARRASLDGGLTPDAIRNVLRSKSRNPRRDTLEGIARGLDWTLEALLELQSGDGAGRINPVQDVPLISWVAAEELRETKDSYAAGGAEDFIPISYNRDTLIALRVQGSSMNRIAPDGSIIIVDFDDRTLSPGQYYVVKHDGDATFKRFRTEPARLEPDSTDSYDTIFITGEIEVVGHVIQVTRKLI
jgi:SOS-response transcriptional repressor LexA